MTWRRRFENHKTKKGLTLEIEKGKVKTLLDNGRAKVTNVDASDFHPLYSQVKNEIRALKKMGYQEVPNNNGTLDLTLLNESFDCNLTVYCDDEQIINGNNLPALYGDIPIIRILPNNDLEFGDTQESDIIKEKDIRLKLNREDCLFPAIYLMFKLNDSIYKIEVFFSSYENLTYIQHLFLHRMGIDIPSQENFKLVNDDEYFSKHSIKSYFDSYKQDNRIDLSTDSEIPLDEKDLNKILFRSGSYTIYYPIYSSGILFEKPVPKNGLSFRDALNELRLIFSEYLTKEHWAKNAKYLTEFFWDSKNQSITILVDKKPSMKQESSAITAGQLVKNAQAREPIVGFD